MKKLMIALAAVAAFAMTSEAASTYWGGNAGSNGTFNDGYKNTGSGTYTAAGLNGATVYMIAVSTDTKGVGISQVDLVKAFRGAAKGTFSLADYAVPAASGNAYATTTSAGKLTGEGHNIAFSNGTAESGDFTVGKNYDFYAAVLMTDGDGEEWLYVSGTKTKGALYGPAEATVTFAPTTTSKANYGSDDFSAAGWYAQSVPEPTSGLLLLLGMAGLALKRKRA